MVIYGENVEDFISDIYLLADVLNRNSSEDFIENLINHFDDSYEKKHIILMWFIGTFASGSVTGFPCEEKRKKYE